jgi:hypothetical protein
MSQDLALPLEPRTPMSAGSDAAMLELNVVGRVFM